MSNQLGKQAVVVGAGIGGLAAAGALANHFDHVIVLESDSLPAQAVPRQGTPQSKHLHALLAGGLAALEDLFPGFGKTLGEAGAVSLCESSDIRRERLGYDPLPQRDLGIGVYSMSRPLLESVIRRKLQEQGNIQIRESCRAKSFVVPNGKTSVDAVSCENRDGQVVDVPADLVVDSTGHGLLTLKLLASLGQPPPAETTVGVDMGYATTCFEMPDEAPPDWKALVTYPNPPENRRGVYVYPIEENRWMVTNTGRYHEKPADNETSFFTHLQQLRTRTAYNVLKRAKRTGSITLNHFKASRRRAFDHQATVLLNLIPFADTICRFNPIYGQGMSVAAVEACLLRRLLREGNGGIGTLASDFISDAQTFIDVPWYGAVIPDFVDPLTEGEPPPNLEKTLKFSAAILSLAAEDWAVQKLVREVQHLVKSRSAFEDPQLQERVQSIMAHG